MTIGINYYYRDLVVSRIFFSHFLYTYDIEELDDLKKFLYKNENHYTIKSRMDEWEKNYHYQALKLGLILEGKLI